MRRNARELAFRLIFERLFVKGDPSLDEEFFASLKKDEEKSFAKDILDNFEKNRDYLSSLISSNLVDYEIDRVYRVDLALMYECLTEIIYNKTPVQVAVNEMVILAKQYSTEKSGRFINGVIASVIKELK